jgi:hypothetical protein
MSVLLTTYRPLTEPIMRRLEDDDSEAEINKLREAMDQLRQSQLEKKKGPAGL